LGRRRADRSSKTSKLVHGYNPDVLQRTTRGLLAPPRHERRGDPYRDSSKYSKLRMFAVHSMACKSPFDKSQEGTERYKEWTKEWTALLKNVPDLISDIARVAGIEWNGTYPWDDEHRKAYLVDQVAPDQLWEEQSWLLGALKKSRQLLQATISAT
jgi:hypothetical protein